MMKSSSRQRGDYKGLFSFLYINILSIQYNKLHGGKEHKGFN